MIEANFRDNEFTTSPSDHPLVVQFAANKVRFKKQAETITAVNKLILG